MCIAGDTTEDEHDICPVHRACIDLDGQGTSLIGPSCTGMITHIYGLLRLNGVRVIMDDWFFVRIQGDDAVAFGSEKNFYVQADIAEVWGKHQKLVQDAEFDKISRAVVNVRNIVGKGKIIPLTTIKKVFLLKRDPHDEILSKELDVEEAVNYVERMDFCNRYLLIKNERKIKL